MSVSRPAAGSDYPRLEAVFPGPPDSLAAAYAAGEPAVRDLFPHLDSWKARTWNQPARLPAAAIGTPSGRTRTKLDAIMAGEGFLVTTGQQPILFGGPLYVLHKALTAIEAARRLEIETGKQCLALFWIASDDHDWAEVARSRIIDTAGALQDFQLPPSPGREAASVGPSPLPEDVLPELHRFIACLPESEFRADVDAVLEEAYRPGRSYAQAFADFLTSLLPEDGWAWVDSADPAVRLASEPLLRWALESRTAAEAAFREGTAAVESVGFSPQMTYLPGATQLFCEVNGRRTRVYADLDGDCLRLGREGDSVSHEDVSRSLAAEPELFSCTASMRPLLESWLLPVGATVLGPSEVGYWAQLGPLFEAAEVQMPAVMTRFGWRVIEKRIARILDRLHTETETLARPDNLARRLVHDSVPPQTGQALTELRAALTAGFDRLESAIESDLPGLKASSGKARKGVAGALDSLERAIDSRTREEQATVVEQVARASLHLYPDGDPQERVLSPFFFAARYGLNFIHSLEELGRDREIPLLRDVAGSVGQG
ncbi:MAG: bacillithiol biosynthesis cysteine-adding enzyme BshC [Gemmatimonadota bacterium]